MSLPSQRANLFKIQSQMRKMAEDARLTGELQIWGNRQNALAGVRAFGAHHGITVVERLRTGYSNVRPDDVGFRQFANGLDNQFRAQARITALAGGVRLGMGTYMVVEGIRQLDNDLAASHDSYGDWLRTGEHVAIVALGGGESIAGMHQMLRQIPRWTSSRRLIAMTKWGGRVGIAGGVLVEGFLVTQYLNGDMPERQFWRSQANMGGGLAGGAAGSFVGLKTGAVVGAGIGSFFGPGPGSAAGAALGAMVGAVGGGIGGGYAGSYWQVAASKVSMFSRTASNGKSTPSSWSASTKHPDGRALLL